MTKVRAAFRANDFDAHHAERIIFLFLDFAAGNFLIEAGPPAFRIKLHVRREKFCAAGGAFVNTFVVGEVIFPREGPVRSFLAEDVVLLRCQDFFPFFFGALDGLRGIFHSCFSGGCFCLAVASAENGEGNEQAESIHGCNFLSIYEACVPQGLPDCGIVKPVTFQGITKERGLGS